MPPKKESWDEALFRFIMRSSGRTAAVIALAFYPGVGLALPLLLGWSLPALIAANVLGVVWAGTVSVGWLAGQVRARDRRHLVEWTTNLRLLNAEEFEWLVGELFRREGWRVRETGQQSGPDGNIDLELTNAAHDRVLVQCKRWTSRLVGVDDVRGFAGTLLREGLPGRAGVFVTLSGFSDAARLEAQTAGMTLVDSADLHARVEKVRRTEPCTECQAPMVLGRSSQGWWLRCVTPGCAGKRHLGGDAGRAVELLLEGS